MNQDGTKCINSKPAEPGEYQLFNPHELIRVASATHAIESDNGVSLLIPRKRLVPLDADLEEASAGQIGNYTCPYFNCPYGNYALGFSTRVKRNIHMLNCVYRNGACQQQHGGLSDHRQIPSARVVNRMAETIPTEAMNIAGSSSQTALEKYSAPVTQAYSRTVILPGKTKLCNISLQIMEPAKRVPEVNNCQAETGVFQNNSNNKFPELGTNQDEFHYSSSEMGGFFDSSFDDGLLTAMDEFLNGWTD